MSHPGLFNEEPNISFTNSTGLPVLRQDVSDTPLISELLTLPRLFLGPTIAIGSGHFFLSVLNSKLQILVIERAGLFFWRIVAVLSYVQFLGCIFSYQKSVGITDT